MGAVYAAVAREWGIDCSADHLTARFIATWNDRSGFRYSREEWAEVVRSSFTGVAEVSEELFDAIYQRFGEARAWLIYDDAIPTLQQLEQRGLKLAVISNWDDRLEPLLSELGLASYFDQILVSSKVGSQKPETRIFYAAAELLEVEADRILHVGDSLREDVEGARSAGFRAMRVRRNGKENESDLASLTSVVELLQRL